MAIMQPTSTVSPWFSIVVSSFNRAGILRRCLESCLSQDFVDFEIVVVDDGSTDDSVSVVRSFTDPKLRLVQHEHNRGLCAARDTGARSARGQWLIQLDSDHGLLPGALENLYRRTSAASPKIGVIGSRYQWDTGRITPSFVPEGPIDYAGRIRWVGEEGGTDYLCCYRRDLYGRVRWPAERRGPLDEIFQFDLAKLTMEQIGSDVIAVEYSDAENSQTRSRGWKGARTLLGYAEDMSWQFDEVLRLHGAALAAHGRRYALTLRLASTFHFLAGHRTTGLRYFAQYLSRDALSLKVWAIAALGMTDRRLLAFVLASWPQRR